MTTLRLLPGGRTDSAHDELHVEIATARAERLVLADKLRGYLRSVERLMAAHPAAAATYLEEASRLVEQDARRALAMEAPCGCGVDGSGHGPADDMALAA